MTGVQPPRGAVTITESRHNGEPRRFHATCAACGWTYTNTVKSDVQTHKRWHQCPSEEP